MKKVLIIANLFHASPRIPGVAAYLPEFNWEATIVTPQLGKGAEINLGFPKLFSETVKVVEAPYCGDIFWPYRKVLSLLGFSVKEQGQSGLVQQIKERSNVVTRRSAIDILMNSYQEMFGYPDAEKTWIKPACMAAEKVLIDGSFDSILSSSPFATNHLIAAKMKKKFGLPWVADFRDPWTQNHQYSYGSLRKHFESRLELRTLCHANAMIAAAPEYARKQNDFHKRPTTVIFNGFPPESLHEVPVALTEKFSVTYTGQIITGKQDPEKLLAVIRKLISEKTIEPENIEVRFYGLRQNWLDDMISKYHLRGIVNQYGIISRYESWQKQKESQVLLILNWEDRREKGVYPSKLFEYFAAGRPILSVGGIRGDDLEKTLAETGAGVYSTIAEEIEVSLLSFYNQYRESGKVSYSANHQEIGKYSYREMARKFAQVLDQII